MLSRNVIPVWVGIVLLSGMFLIGQDTWPQHCVQNPECGSAEKFCLKPVGECDGEGVCMVRPSGCPDVWDPVCGCDGTTYGNECESEAAGVSLAHRGECILPACQDNVECLLPEEYCRKLVGDCNGYGTCEEKPTACPEILDPVCGCDEVTYENECFAAMSGVSVAHAGECKTCELGYFAECESEWECVKTPRGDCCGCEMGGAEAAVNSSRLQEWLVFLDMNCPPDIECLAVYLCTGRVPTCTEGCCELVSP